MRNWLGPILVSMTISSAANAQVTKVATFENITEGQTFKPSFKDPLSGVVFHDSTNSSGGFVIDYSATEFGGGNYLSAGVYSPGPLGGWGGDFGFTADLPSPANQVTTAITYPGFGNTSLVTLTGFNSTGNSIVQQSGPANAADPFTVQIDRGQFDITRFQVQVPAGFSAGYDNISFTIVPEPCCASIAVGAMVALCRRRR